MDFPKLRALAVIGLACCKGRDQGSLIAIGSQAGIDRSDCSFAARLCYCRHKVLRGARVLANKSPANRLASRVLITNSSRVGLLASNSKSKPRRPYASTKRTN